MDISVIIPTYNSARTLSQCLDSAKRQSITCHEILVVDRHSRDRTIEIAAASGAKVIQADVNRSAARNIGVMNCSSEAIIFVDSDMIMSEKVLEDCVGGLRVHNALIIPEISLGSGFWATCRAKERQTNLGDTLIEAPRCFRKDAFLSLGGYNPNLVAGEDWDLHTRTRSRNFSIGRIESIMLHDEGDSDLIKVLHKKYEYGKSMHRYFKSNAGKTLLQVNPIRRILFTGFKIIPSDPLHGFGFIFLKTSEFVAAGLGSLSAIAEPLNSTNSRK